MPDGVNDFHNLLFNAIYKNKIKKKAVNLFWFQLIKFAFFIPEEACNTTP